MFMLRDNMQYADSTFSHNYINLTNTVAMEK